MADDASASPDVRPLHALQAGMEILFGGDRLVRVPAELAARFRPGDSLLVIQTTGELLHVPAAERQVAGEAVRRAHGAFARMGGVEDGQISAFFEGFAARLEDPDIWGEVAAQNRQDVADAQRRGRSVTRLVADEKLRQGMIAGLRGWLGAPSRRGRVIEQVSHEAFEVALVGAELGVVGFVFEGRPNVLADATGVLRGGNTVVFRIGRDALGTARALMRLALEPALAEAGLPEGAVSLVDSPSHAAGWSLVSDRRLALAVARGSGPAVATLGALASQAGVAVSLHGTGGAWLVASPTVNAQAFHACVVRSLDRKVCNTLNVCCVPRARAAELVPILLDALQTAGARRNQAYKLHVVEGDEAHVPSALFETVIDVRRAEGDVREPQAERLPMAALGQEWEWEETPEITLKVVEGLEEAVDLCNRHSPQFVASLLSEDPAEHAWFYTAVNAPFIGDAHTRWVDGQYALRRPELGLSNWQAGRLFGRGGILTGDDVFTVRTRYRSKP